MNTGIMLNVRIGDNVIRRANYLQLTFELRQLSTAEMHVQDKNFVILRSVSVGDVATITHGYFAGKQITFAGVVVNIETIGANNIHIRFLGKIDYALATTYITESYNDENPNVIVNNLLSTAGVRMGDINLPSEPVPHIIFSNISVWGALAQLRQLFVRLHGKSSDYYLRYDSLYWGDEAVGNTIAVNQGNIISHKHHTLELPLIPTISLSDSLSIHDVYRKQSSTHRADKVIHSYNNGKIRSFVGYNLWM